VTDEDPPPGVIATAGLIFAGGGLACLLAVSHLAAPHMPPAPPESPSLPLPQVFSQVNWALSILECVGLGAWGMTTAVGLLNLRAWARASVLAMCGMIIPFFMFLLLLALTDSYARAQLMPEPSVGSIVLFLLFLLPAWIALAWVIYFNLRGVRMRFGDSPAEGHLHAHAVSAEGRPAPLRRPISVTATAMLFLTGTAFFLVGLLRTLPVFLFGRYLEGTAAGTAYSCAFAVALAVGAGLLNLRPWARVAAIACCQLQLLNYYLFEGMPRAEVGIAMLLDGVGVRFSVQIASELLPLLLRIAFLLNCVISAAILWPLVLRRNAFVDEVARTGA
jgi:hypothetical protein